MSSAPASHAEWIALIREGCAGNAQPFQLRLSRLIARLRREKSTLADLLSKALADANAAQMTLARDSAAQQATLVPIDAESSLPLTTVQYPVVLEHRPVWPSEIETGLRVLVDEWANAGKLIEAGLAPSRTVLLSGPPGTGKTLTAGYLAEQLNLPLVSLNLAATVNSLLGKTGNNLTRVLNHARAQPCVLLLDEFDTFAKRRDDGQDVGELKRVVNVLLQAIDEWPSTSLLVAATNHEELLDRAIFRRFDFWLRFPASTFPQIEALLIQLGCTANLAAQLAPGLVGQPLSDVHRLVVRSKRKVILEGETFERSILSLANPALIDTGIPADADRLSVIQSLRAEGKSMRAIGRELGLNASSVSRMLARLDKDKS
ncbi:AAA family ATPase [Pseudomonas defluvii]|uniref:AAA family ATPase n=1 Tax=Pseudomonas defluvii TaxID=1876757 RepID=UPI0039062EC3